MEVKWGLDYAGLFVVHKDTGAQQQNQLGTERQDLQAQQRKRRAALRDGSVGRGGKYGFSFRGREGGEAETLKIRSRYFGMQKKTV